MDAPSCPKWINCAWRLRAGERGKDWGVGQVNLVFEARSLKLDD